MSSVKTTVKELIEKLENFEPDMKIVMSEVPEGNRFYPGSITVDENYWWDPDEQELLTVDDFEEEPYGEPVIVLWPDW